MRLALPSSAKGGFVLLVFAATISCQKSPPRANEVLPPLRKLANLQYLPSETIGTQHPFVFQYGSYGLDWVVACQAREDTSGDGRVAIGFGHHGHITGDAARMYLFYGGAPEIEIDSLAAVSSSNRYVSYSIGDRVLLLDTATGQRMDLNQLGGVDPESLRFGENEDLFLIQTRLGVSRVLRLDPEDGSGVVVYSATRPIVGMDLEEASGTATVYEVPEDTNLDGQQSATLNTTHIRFHCAGPSGSYGYYGFGGDSVVPRTLWLPAKSKRPAAQPAIQGDIPDGCSAEGNPLLLGQRGQCRGPKKSCTGFLALTLLGAKVKDGFPGTAQGPAYWTESVSSCSSTARRQVEGQTREPGEVTDATPKRIPDETPDKSSR